MNPTVSIPKPVSISVPAQQESSAKPAQPLPLWASTLLFAIPTALAFLSFHWFRPWLENFGYSPLKSFQPLIPDL